MYSNILQIDGARLKRPINIFKGRTAIQAGVLGRQEPYETHQVEMQCSAVPGNDTSWELTRWERASCMWASHVLWQQRRTTASLAIWTRALPGDLGKQLALSTQPTRYWTTEDGSGPHSKKDIEQLKHLLWEAGGGGLVQPGEERASCGPTSSPLYLQRGYAEDRAGSSEWWMPGGQLTTSIN